MVNKIDGNNYYVYTKQKKIDISDIGEKFNLDYQKGETPSEAADKKEVSDQEKQQQTQQSGVRLELSGSGRDAGTDRQRQAQAAKAQSERTPMQMPLLETIRAYIMSAIAAVQEFFHSIWNGRPQEDDLQNAPLLDDVSQNILSAGDIMQSVPSETSQETLEMIDASDQISVPAMDEERRNREIQQSLRNGDMDQVINLLTENGKRTIARNSTLLTSYDKNGRVVEPNASDRERALHGDRNTWKL